MSNKTDNIRNINLQYLRTFINVYETQSFKKAAGLSFRSPATLYRDIVVLEDLFGVALLERKGFIQIPTKAGEILYSKAKALLNLNDEVVNVIKMLK